MPNVGGLVMGGPSVDIFFAVVAIEGSYFASRLNRQHNVSSFLTMFGFDRRFCCWPIKPEYPGISSVSIPFHLDCSLTIHKLEEWQGPSKQQGSRLVGTFLGSSWPQRRLGGGLPRREESRSPTDTGQARWLFGRYESTRSPLIF